MTKMVAPSEDAYAAFEAETPRGSFSDVVLRPAEDQRTRLEDVLEEPDEPAATHWATFQEERRKAREEHTSRVSLED